MSELGATPTLQRPVDGDVAVRLRGVTKVFGHNVVLDDLDLEIRRGEFACLLGPSGTGKTTLLRILAGLEQPDSGEVLVAERRTVVYQEPRLIPTKRVLGNVLLGRRKTPEARAAAADALAEVGLAGHLKSWPATLSGGEAQRVALARALVREPELLMLDEPFAALDALTRLHMQDLVSDLCALHRPAVLLVTHDVDEAIILADRIVVLRDGHLATDVRIDLDRPRDRGSPAFLEHRLQFLEQLGVHRAATEHLH